MTSTSFFDLVSQDLAERAKKLMHGMRERTNRDPDIADFKAAFLEVLRKWSGDKQVDVYRK